MGNRWGDSGNSVRLFLGGLQNHCRWWWQPSNLKMLAPWEKSYDQPRQHIKNRDITLPTKVRLVRAMVFPVVVYGCESWTIKKAEHGRTDAFELCRWRRLLRVLWTTWRWNQSILKEKREWNSLSRVRLCDPMGYTVHGILQEEYWSG